MMNTPQPERGEFGPERLSGIVPQLQEPVFAIELVRGTRAFNLDETGWLRGVTYPYSWYPEENVALCLRQAQKGKWELNPKPEHSVAKCTHGVGHGFYAYFNGSNTYSHPLIGRPEAVIEGYGTGLHATVIGSKGFRAGKARIIALFFPSVMIGKRAAYEKALQRYASIPMFDTYEAMVSEFPLSNGLAYA